MILWKCNTLISNNDGTSSRRNRKPKRKDTKVTQPSGPTDNVVDEVVYEEMDDSLERVATTATSLDAEQDRGNINKTQSKATLNEPSSLRTSSDSGLRCQETIGDTNARTTNKLPQKLLQNDVSCNLWMHFETKGIDEQEAIRLQAEFDKEERLAREKDEANVALTKEWNDIQAKIDVDCQLAQRLQAQEQEELTDDEKARLFVQFLEQRRKYFAAKRVEEKRNIPLTRAQQRSIMCTYLKNMEGWKPKSLKNKSFANIQELFNKAFTRVNTFVDYRTELMEESSKKAEVMEESSKKSEVEIAQESSSKKAGEALEQESSKK
ncbi:hypothetical protein Tco_1267651 [Tanacetum coccineum]